MRTTHTRSVAVLRVVSGKGLSAGGHSYGYKPDPLNKGKLLIVPEEAEVIRRVFQEYAAGRSPRAIAHDLNAAGFAPPRSSKWNASTINGSRDRGNGILHNSLYRGQLIWNKVRMMKDPDTGRRVSRTNPVDQWQTTEVPELRIVSQELFEKAQEYRNSVQFERPQKRQRPKRLLSGLLRCGSCGSGMCTGGKDKSGCVRIRCSAHFESGTCPNPKTFYLDRVEELVLSSLLGSAESSGNVRSLR